MSNALGETVGAEQKTGTKTCTWVAESGPPSRDADVFAARRLELAQDASAAKSGVSGVGDDAIAETLGNLTTLFVKKGNTTFTVRVYGVPAAPKQLAIETPIAQAIAAKW